MTIFLRNSISRLTTGLQLFFPAEMKTLSLSFSIPAFLRSSRTFLTPFSEVLENMLGGFSCVVLRRIAIPAYLMLGSTVFLAVSYHFLENVLPQCANVLVVQYRDILCVDNFIFLHFKRCSSCVGSFVLLPPESPCRSVPYFGSPVHSQSVFDLVLWQLEKGLSFFGTDFLNRSFALTSTPDALHGSGLST